jgi:hypothetical protein
MIRARPRHLFSWDFDFLLDDGSSIPLDMAGWLREGGRFTWAGTEYQIVREGFWFRDFLLAAEGQVLARATKISLFGRSFAVRLSDRDLELRASWFSRRFGLIAQDAVVGMVSPDGFFTRSWTAEFPEDLSVPVQVFLLSLAILMWRRQNNAAAASSG